MVKVSCPYCLLSKESDFTSPRPRALILSLKSAFHVAVARPFLFYLGNILQRAMVWFGYEAPSAARRSNEHALGTCGISEESGYNPSPSYKSHILRSVFFWQACAHSCVDRRLLHASGLESLWPTLNLDISTECCWFTLLYNLSPQITNYMASLFMPISRSSVGSGCSLSYGYRLERLIQAHEFRGIS